MDKTFFELTVKTNQRTYNIRKITTGQGHYYTTDCLLDYLTENLNWAIDFIIEEAKETILDMSVL